MHSYNKIPAEKAALAHDAMPGTVLRLPMVIGPHDWQRRILPLAKPMADARLALVWSEELRGMASTFGYVQKRGCGDGARRHR